VDVSFSPGYIPRTEEEAQILEESAKVRQDGHSRVVLLYGPGGVGKTQLVRHLRDVKADDTAEIWVDPVDIDDPEFWLLSNLERRVADRLDPSGDHFERYTDYLSRLPALTRREVSHETVVSHLGRIKRVFAECYHEFVTDSEKTVVIILDTVETIRGLYLLQTLTQWIKSLPGTLFILCGRPDESAAEDAIKNELLDAHQQMTVTTIELGDFSEQDATAYLDDGRTGVHLDEAERIRLVHLTRGHPLWLAFTVSYLREEGLPPEAEAGPPEQVEASLAHLRHVMPFGEPMLQEGQELHDSFKQRLVAPYQNSDFWHEAVKRLAVVRENVDQRIWERLMADQSAPAEAEEPGEAWQRLQKTEWIRPRANSHYVTLHDAVAEELAQRLIPLHDLDRHWRRDLWRRAADIYAGLTEGPDAQLRDALSSLDESLQAWYTSPERTRSRGHPQAVERHLIKQTEQLEARKRELCQTRAIRLYYEILCDFNVGTRMFLSTFNQAKDDHDILFQDLLAFEMQRFLPGEADTFNEVIREVVEAFRRWLLRSDEGQARYLEIAISLADYLIRAEMPARALTLLDEQLELVAGPDQRNRLSNLRGNACMRIPGQMPKAQEYFERALASAQQSDSPTKYKLVAAAYKELGFFHRNEGRWDLADKSYALARNEISRILSAASPEQDREEMASIQTNWAYVKGLTGSYRDGTNLVESAINVRRRLKFRHEEGISWSVCGEVYRYEHRFQNAWTAYIEAEQIFQDLKDWSWLGQIYQEQAICLYQASQDGIDLTPDRHPVEQAKRLITLSMDLCSDLAIRSYPSALNRAGRIFGDDEPEQALRYLADGIEWAHDLSDGWFWFANLIEYVELCYGIWTKTRNPDYVRQIRAHEDDIADADSQYRFPDLRGRWLLLQGHMRVREALESRNHGTLPLALEDFKQGFILLAQRYVGSSGMSAVASEFTKLAALTWELPPEIRAQWQAEFQRSWSQEEYGSTLLLARLEELY
jgi:tetratricopeptide (TPR) repeat protein/energy-coupling factor transporter ATP-binding protein EcfA2